MAAVEQYLVRRGDGLVLLFTPPFGEPQEDGHDPGYIRGYPPGVRENGGQYTHAAIWAAMAFAEMGDRRRAWELFTMINPVNRTQSAAAVATYKVEPYVMAADVYAAAPHVGRGGWTWYTGSAGWMYRLVIESLLGIRLEVDRLRIEPLIPAAWPGFELRYRHREATSYEIHCRRGGADEPAAVRIDGVLSADGTIPLHDHGRTVAVEVVVTEDGVPVAAGRKGAQCNSE